MANVTTREFVFLLMEEDGSSPSALNEDNLHQDEHFSLTEENPGLQSLQPASNEHVVQQITSNYSLAAENKMENSYIIDLIKKDHDYVGFENRDYKALYTLSHRKLELAQRKLKVLKTAVRRLNNRKHVVKKILKEIKKKAYSKIGEILKESKDTLKEGKPKKVIIVM